MTAKRTLQSMLAAAALVGGAALQTGCYSPTADRTAVENRDDAETTAKVKAALAADPQYKYQSVVVTTFRGVVQLGGFVDSEAQKKTAGEIAGKVSGVRSAENKISVKETAK